jgi:hypothetical protein
MVCPYPIYLRPDDFPLEEPEDLDPPCDELLLVPEPELMDLEEEECT